MNTEVESPFAKPNSKDEENNMKSPNKLDIIEQEVNSLSNSVNIEEEDETAEAD